MVLCAFTSMNGFWPFLIVGRPRGPIKVMSWKMVEVLGSPTKMHASSIQHSTIDPEKSTVMFEARTETCANALYSPGGTITDPDCAPPVGLLGINRAAISASCNPLEALEMVDPAACDCAVLNRNVPGRPSPPQLPPVTLTGSAPAAPGLPIKTQYSGSFPFTPAGQAGRLTTLAPACVRFSGGVIDQLYSFASKDNPFGEQHLAPRRKSEGQSKARTG